LAEIKLKKKDLLGYLSSPDALSMIKRFHCRKGEQELRILRSEAYLKSSKSC
jgi:hypothetical protein